MGEAQAAEERGGGFFFPMVSVKIHLENHGGWSELHHRLLKKKNVSGTWEEQAIGFPRIWQLFASDLDLGIE